LSKPPLLLIPGWTISGEIWNSVEYLQHYQSPDLPGINSNKQKFIPNTNAYNQAITYLRIYIKKYFTEPPIILGWSMGGQLALELQDLAKGLIIVNSTPFYALDENPTKIFLEMAKLNHIKALRYFYSIAGKENKLLSTHSDTNKDIIMNYLTNLIKSDYRTSKSQKKSLVIHSINDKIIPFKHSKMWIDIFDDCEIKPIKTDSHFPFLIDSVRDTILTFLESF